MHGRPCQGNSSHFSHPAWPWQLADKPHQSQRGPTGAYSSQGASAAHEACFPHWFPGITQESAAKQIILWLWLCETLFNCQIDQKNKQGNCPCRTSPSISLSPPAAGRGASEQGVKCHLDLEEILIGYKTRFCIFSVKEIKARRKGSNKSSEAGEFDQPSVPWS